MMKWRFLPVALVSLFPWAGLGQNLAPNPSFEEGAADPTGWTLSGGVGRWENFGRAGARSLSLTGTGSSVNSWQTTNCPVEPGRPYVVRFWGTASNAVGGLANCGFDTASRDFRSLTPPWTAYAFVATLPSAALAPRLRLGQTVVNGTLIFDDVEVLPAQPFHSWVGDDELGAGESLASGQYLFQTVLGKYAGNSSRCLHQHTASFLTDRWLLDTNAFVVYRHKFAGLTFTNAQVKVTLNYYGSGALVVEAGTNGQDWLEAGRLQPTTNGWSVAVLQTNLPPELLPAPELYVRLRATGNLQVNNYRFEGDLPGNALQAEGQTWLLEQYKQDAAILPIQMSLQRSGHVLTFQLRNADAGDRQLTFRTQVEGPVGLRQQETTAVVPAQTTNVFSLELPSAGAGENTVRLEIEDTALGQLLSQSFVKLTVTAFTDSSFGWVLPSPEDCAVWWCEGTYKVTRERFLPPATNDAVEISAARNEYEPFQLVLRPPATLSNVLVSVSDFAFQGGPGVAPINATNVQVCLVEYVPGTDPSDSAGEVGNYPDPLVPLTGPFTVEARTNQPL